MVAGMFTFTLFLGVFMYFVMGGDSLPDEIMNWLTEYFMIFFGGVWAIVLVGIGALFSLKRLYVYAGMFLITFTGGELLNIAPPYYVTGLGIVLSLIGLVMIVRFFTTHPVQEVVILDERE